MSRTTPSARALVEVPTFGVVVPDAVCDATIFDFVDFVEDVGARIRLAKHLPPNARITLALRAETPRQRRISASSA